MNVSKMTTGLIPEWHPQDAVLLAWPDETMDWSYILTEVRACYTQLITALLGATDVVLLMRDQRESLPAELQAMQSGESGKHRLKVVDDFQLNDTWMRDVMPLFGATNGQPVAYDFGFNGWGLKFASNLDNSATRRLFRERSLFSKEVRYINRLGTILEGGAIDINSRGELLTTACVLHEENRNPSYNQQSTAEYFYPDMGINKVHLLTTAEPLEGDDTDGHIDTLARFADDDTLLYCSCDNPQAPHYAMLKNMEQELQALTNIEGKPYRCIPLPLPAPIYDEEGQQLPATYANFLISNGTLFLPIYNDPNDSIASEIVRQALPQYRVVTIDCRALIQQHGSLHCITMQVPQGYLLMK